MKYLILTFCILLSPRLANAQLSYELLEINQSAGWSVEGVSYSFDGGTLTTDGTLGRLQAGNVVDWNMTFTTHTGTYTFHTGNSVMELINEVPLGLPSLDATMEGITASPTFDPTHNYALSFRPQDASAISIWWSEGVEGPRVNIFDLSGDPGTINRAPLPTSPNNVAITAVPEPSSVILLLVAASAFYGYRMLCKRM